MFKTMDNVAVYDKNDIDASLGIKPAGKGTAFECIAELENSKADKSALAEKADKSYAMATRELVAENTADINVLEGKTQHLENDMVTKSELAQDVSNIVDDIIDSKIALIMSDINTIVANAIGVALQNYDTSTVVDNKIAAATTPMSSAEVIAVVEQYF